MASRTVLSSRENRQLLTTIDFLYDAVCDLEKWPAFLDSAATLLEAQGAQIGHHDLDKQSLSFSRLHGYEWDAEHYQKYDALIGEDPRLPYFMNHPFQAVHCRMGVTEETLHRSRVYQEVLRPGGVEYSLGVSFNEEAHSLSYFLALRSPEQPAFAEKDCALLEELIPHLRRAMQLQREMAALDLEKTLSIQALDAMAVGIVMLNGDLAIRFANRTARNVLKEGDGLAETGGKLLVTHDDHHRLKRCVGQLITQSSTGQTPAGESLTIRRASSRPPYNALISPYWGDQLRSGWASIREPQAFFVLRDPDSPRESREELLGRMYGLTPSQAALVCLICEGLSVREAADTWGITEASARQYLKLVFQKMDVSRQGQMVSKVLNSLATLG